MDFLIRFRVSLQPVDFFSIFFYRTIKRSVTLRLGKTKTKHNNQPHYLDEVGYDGESELSRSGIYFKPSALIIRAFVQKLNPIIVLLGIYT